ncbi:MAG: D-glycero-beta-D-manno-heptose 1-phosphate adenylyltransferase [Blautia sp.]|nr:D-glycero-beta-D-manno-heptose 1-phosphate adenylyltransferase [Blautia sp.]
MELKRQIMSKSILVVGDVMLDTYYYGDIERISPEAPVPVFRKKSERYVLGGAGNVAANLIAADQQVSVMAVTGEDENGNRLREILNEKNINTDLLVALDRNTTVKTRFLAANNQQVLRLDIEDTNELKEEEYKVLLDAFEEKISKFEIILMSDYMKGLLGRDFTQCIIRMAKARDIPVVIDVKDSQAAKYKDAFLVKPNLNELKNLTGMSIETDDEIIDASGKLREMCECRYVLTTCGARGMVLVSAEESFFLKSIQQEVFDVTGAGDTAIAYLAACMANGFSVMEAVEIANYAAGIQVGKTGTSSVCWREVWEYIMDQKRMTLYKILEEKDVAVFRKEHMGQKVVFTNGCFDILHTGHIRYLREAAKLGDILILGLNSDASVKRLKGSERPINNELDRAEILCALEYIDYVAIFNEDTPLELIKKIQPDVLVKGGDYSNEYVIGTKEVEAWGGKLVLIPFVEGKSTTNIIKVIEKTFQDNEKRAGCDE